MRLASLIWGATPAVPLAIVEANEETGNVLFELTSRIAKDIELDSGVAGDHLRQGMGE